MGKEIKPHGLFSGTLFQYGKKKIENSVPEGRSEANPYRTIFKSEEIPFVSYDSVSDFVLIRV